MARLRGAFAPVAAAMAGSLGGPTELMTGRLPAEGHWFSDDDVLAVVGGPDENQAGIDLLLAYGLAHAADRDVWLVLPDGFEAPTLARLPWIEPHVKVWTHHDGTAGPELVVPARVEVQASLRDPLTKDVHALGDREPWVSQLLAWVDDHPELVEASRGSYRSWHCDGRQVLRIERTSGGLRVTAGVAYSKPTGDQQAALETQLAGPISPEDLTAVQARVEVAIGHRKDGTDDTHVEHRFQARLQPSALDLVDWDRERPAVRAGGALGYIDFLGIDAAGTVHVVETKIGPDPMLPLQGLDYWVWADAHREVLSTRFETTVSKVVIDFVTAPKAGSKRPLSPYAQPIATAIDGSVPWRFWTAPPGWLDADAVEPVPHPWRTVPAE